MTFYDNYKNFLEEFSMERRAQRTIVFLLETCDFQNRKDQVKEAINSGGLTKLLRLKEDPNAIGYDLQRNKMYKLRDNVSMPSGQLQNPLDEIYRMMTQSSTIVVIDYVFMQEHADALTDWLKTCCQNPAMYQKNSSLMVFVDSETWFPETLRRLCYTIKIPASTAEEREEVLTKLANELKQGCQAKYGTELPEKIDLTIRPEHITSSSGLDTGQLQTAAMKSFFQNFSFKTEVFTEAKVRLLATYGYDYVHPKYSFKHIGGYDIEKQMFNQKVKFPLKNPDVAKKYGVGLPRGILLTGLPGCGKSFLCTTAAYELGLPIIKVDHSIFFKGIVGESEKAVKHFFDTVESVSPVVLLMEEVDGIAPSRDNMIATDSGVSRRIENTILDRTGAKDRSFILMCTTNYVNQLDKAFVRSGRIDETFLILPPAMKARVEILGIHLDSDIRHIPMNKKEKPAIIQKVAKGTYMWTGAELEKLALDAARIAMVEQTKYVTMEHFEEAMKNFEVNTSKRQESIQREIEAVLKMENVSKGYIQKTTQAFQEGEGDSSRTEQLIAGLNL